MSYLAIRNVILHNSDVEDEAVSEVNMIYASQVTQLYQPYSHPCMHIYTIT